MPKRFGLPVLPKPAWVHPRGSYGGSVLRSGKPGICLPSVPFQYLWGDEAQKYGAGRVIWPQAMMQAFPEHNLLADAVQQVTNGTGLANQATKLAVEIRQQAQAFDPVIKAGGGAVLAAQKIQVHVQELHQRLQAKKGNSEL